ncbi:MAG: autotransporter domain-containing protein, partial [Thermaurantiacus sp.]
GEIHASARGAALEDSRFVREAVLGRLAGMDERAVWMQAYGAWGTFDGDGNAADVKRRIGGVFLGIDVVRTEGFTAGLVTGVAGGTVQVRERSSGANTEDAHLGAYAAFGSGGFGARVGLAQMWRKVDSRRRAEFTGFSQFLTARYDQELFQAFAEIGYQAQLNGWTLEPFGSAAWVKVKTKDIRESGGSAALSSSGASDDYWITQLGARASVNVGANASLTGSAAWRHLGGDDRTTPVPLAFASGPGFTVLGAPMASDAAALGLSLTGRIAPNAEVDVGYSGVVGNRISDHGGRASLRIRF